MDAQTSWNVWRKILTEPKFADAVLAGDVSALSSQRLTPEEIEICICYANTPRATQWFISNYRYRLVSSTAYALETSAPLTWRLLRAHKVDPRALAETFLDYTGWIDRGPYVYTTCQLILDFIKDSYASRIPYLNDLARLETAAATLLCSLAGDPAAFPGQEGPLNSEESKLAPNRNVSVVTIPNDLRPWLKDPSLIGKTTLASAPLEILVRIPSPSASVRYTSIGASGRQLLHALDRPKTRRELLAAVATAAADGARIASVLDRLIELGAIAVGPA
jgi:hypothetical protein